MGEMGCVSQNVFNQRHRITFNAFKSYPKLIYVALNSNGKSVNYWPRVSFKGRTGPV